MIYGLIKYRDLLSMLILRDIRIRYKQAAMGFLWAVFMPIVAVLAGVVIKKAMALVSGTTMDKSEIVSVAVKILPWTFFVSSIKFSVQSLIGNQNLVTKIYFPREVLPIASICACLFDFLLASLVLSVLLIFFQVGVSVYLLLLPLVLLCLFLFTAGFGLLLSAANLFYRDVRYIVEVILTFGIFFTPVFYDAGLFGDKQFWLLLNPIGSLLTIIETIVVDKTLPDLFWFAYAAAASVVTFAVGINIFHRSEPYFAENI